MNHLFFWREWQKSYQYYYLSLLMCLIISLLWFFFEYFTATSRSFPISIQAEVKSQTLTWYKFNKGVFELSAEGENFVVEERFQSEAFQLNTYAPYLYGIAWLIVGITLLAVASTLGILWYAISMTLFIFFLSQLKLDFIGFLKPISVYAGFVVCLLAYLPLSFYFQTQRADTQFFKRLATFALLTFLLGGATAWANQIPNPVSLIVSHAASIPLLLSLVFITIIAHEIPLGLFTLIHRYNASGGRQNLIHFSIIMLIYLANLGLIYLKQNGYFNTYIWTIDTFWFYVIALILGIWGYSKRSILIENILPFAPQGAYFYLAGGVLTTATIAYHTAMVNDPMLDVINDVILFSFIGFGIGFYVYLLINFSQLIKLNYHVTDIIYQGRVFPYWIVRYFGFGLAFILYLSINQYTYYQAKAGYYNMLADAHWLNRDVLLAQKYYEIAKNNDYYNHRSNYILSLLAEQQKDYKNLMLYLLESVKRQPIEHTFLKISALYDSQNLGYEAKNYLQEGRQIFPKSMALINNLALLYAKDKALDSALFYLAKAEEIDKKNKIVQNNTLAFLVNNPPKNLSLSEIIKNISKQKGDLHTQINTIALHNAYQKEYTMPQKVEEVTAQMQANAIGLAFTHNYLLNKLGKKDQTADVLAQHFEKIDKKRDYAYSFNFIKANYDYFQGNTIEGIKRLAAMPVLKSESYYNTILAFWLMQQQADALAIPYLDKAQELGNANASFYKAIALSELGDMPLAKQTWQELLNSKNKSIQDFAQKILPILQDKPQLMTDWDKYNFVRYNKQSPNTEQLLNIAQSIQDKHYKNWALVHIVQRLLDQEKLADAEKVYALLVETPNIQPIIKSEINLTYCRLLVARQNYDDLLKEIDNLLLVFPHKHHKNYLKAIVWEAKNDLIEAEKYYLKAVKTTPYLEPAILKIANFYQNYKKDADKAYQFLVEAVRLNPFSVPILKQYALQALAIGLDFYGDDAMNRLQELTDKTDFEKAVAQYEQAKKQLLEKRTQRQP